jgi:hypothetical protein
VQIFLPVVPSDVTILSRQLNWELDDQINHILILEKEKYTFWGFTESPDMMTEVGKDLYINVISYSLSGDSTTAVSASSTISIAWGKIRSD